jgi:hypothetical protein
VAKVIDDFPLGALPHRPDDVPAVNPHLDGDDLGVEGGEPRRLHVEEDLLPEL